jgi:asparagine synthase (glutamine-hydrolysing)
MSGIVGIINLDGAPVDRPLLEKLTDFLAFRGPDAQSVWSDGHVGFGHTMLRTTWESENEQQPCSLDGRVWITADARVDGRDDLVRLVAGKGRDVLKGATDPQLILHAYHAWGDGCVQHLIGDFAFAIWDRDRHRLFCARDHLGAKPFFYAKVADVLLLSNTLNCLRLHPDISDRLNDLAIADFLLFGQNQELSTTSFADIQRLPPAHTLTWSAEGLRRSRYWELTEGETVQFKRKGDYVERFQQLLRAAVDDRLRTERVGVFMSGGLDSSAIAATASQLLSERHAQFDLRAHTVVYDRLIPDKERYYSGLVAARLGIPIHYLVADDYQLFERRGSAELQRPEPSCDPLAVISDDLNRQAAAHSRVVLAGWDGDEPLRFTLRAHFTGLVRARRFGRLAADVAGYLWTQREWPMVGLRLRLRRLWGDRFPRPSSGPPRWLNPAFVERLDLLERWDHVNQGYQRDLTSPRAVAYQGYRSPTTPYLLEGDDAGVTSHLVEVRNPFMDLRLLNYLLSLPALPWCFKKRLFRVAMRELLPSKVRNRPKSPLIADPTVRLLRQPGAGWINDLDATMELENYVNVVNIPRFAGTTGLSAHWWLDLGPFCLDHWLRCSMRSRRTWSGGVFLSRSISAAT